MKFKYNWKIIVGVSMLLLACVFYFLHYMIFRDPHHIFIFLVGDIAFMFIEVLMVTLIIHHLLQDWEKKSHLKKLNMIIEVFFSEFGKSLLASLSSLDKNLQAIRDKMTEKKSSCQMDFKAAFSAINRYKADIDMDRINLHELAGYLKSNRTFIVSMMQNPNLLEHQTFTETIMAIFHVTEELVSRDLNEMTKEDLTHIKTDIERAYNKLIFQWLSYMKYTEEHFPYFFVFALRTNPFDEKADWINRRFSLIKTDR